MPDTAKAREALRGKRASTAAHTQITRAGRWPTVTRGEVPAQNAGAGGTEQATATPNTTLPSDIAEARGAHRSRRASIVTQRGRARAGRWPAVTEGAVPAQNAGAGGTEQATSAPTTTPKPPKSASHGSSSRAKVRDESDDEASGHGGGGQPVRSHKARKSQRRRPRHCCGRSVRCRQTKRDL